MTPIFKWAGGKSAVLQELVKYVPERIDTYVEPFVGGGAMFLWMLDNRKDIQRIIINDKNPNLTNVYNAVKNDVGELMWNLNTIANEFNYTQDKEGVYKSIRNEYNDSIGTLNTRMAALFIALNKTCYNGLYRLNKDGKFNVAFNHTKNPNLSLYDRDNLVDLHESMDKVEITSVPFEEMNYKEKHAFYYLDPPYRQTSSSSFNKYTEDGFNDMYQILLKRKCDEINKAKSKFLLSNSLCMDGFFENLYSKYNIETIESPRKINSKGDARGNVNEILVHN